MSKIIRLVLLLVLFASCNSNQSINDKSKRNEDWSWFIDSKTGEGSWIEIDGPGGPLEDGKYVLFYKNGAIREKRNVENGHIVDTSFYYSPNKNQIIKYSFRIENTDTVESRYLVNGQFKLYYANMKLAEEGVVNNKRRQGIWKKYFESGSLNMLSGYKDGRPNGVNQVWDEEGNLLETSYWKNGKADGIMELYYINSNLKEQSIFINGKRNGTCKTFYTNGKLNTKEEYVDDKLNGVAEKWSESGLQIYSIEHKNGKKNGTFIYFHENGKISQKGTMLNEKTEGTISFYDVNGQLFQIDHYENGDLVRIEEK